MSSVSTPLDNLYKKYMMLGKSFRYLLVGGVMTLVYAVIDIAIVQPMLGEFNEVTKAIEKAKADSKSYAAKMLNVQNQFDIDPTLSDQEQVNAMASVLAKLETEINTTSSDFVSPNQMVDLLYDILNKGKTLSIVSVEKLPANSMSENKEREAPVIDIKNIKETLNNLEATKKTPKVDDKDKIYRYEVELVIQGSYHEILKYIQQLESMHWRIFWENAELTVESYPLSQLRFSVYTISMEKDWLIL